MNTEFPTYFSSKHALSMELRDYFAAKAMQGFVLSGLDLMTIQDDAICQASYDLADAMMEARKEKK
jgi:hypothetical protein